MKNCTFSPSFQIHFMQRWLEFQCHCSAQELLFFLNSFNLIFTFQFQSSIVSRIMWLWCKMYRFSLRGLGPWHKVVESAPSGSYKGVFCSTKLLYCEVFLQYFIFFWLQRGVISSRPLEKKTPHQDIYKKEQDAASFKELQEDTN